jgi:hypothetical protein
MEATLQSSQFCGIHENTVFDAVAAVRDAAAYAAATRNPLCIVTIDFEAFDKISHSYLSALLNEYGFSEQVQQRKKRTYDNAQ